MAKKTEKEELVAKGPSAVANAIDYGADAGAGFENQDSSFVKIPHVKVLQALSDEVAEKRGDIGQFFNNITEEAVDVLHFVPSYIEHHYMEWTPRDEGGGLVGVHKPTDKIVMEARSRRTKDSKGPLMTPNGTELKETFNMYGITLNPETGDTCQVAVPIANKKIGPFKEWNSRVRMFTMDTPSGRKSPPLFAHRVILTTWDDQTPKGKFKNIHINPHVNNDVKASLLSPSDPLYQAAKDLSEVVKAGRVVVEKDEGPDWNT